MDGSPSKLAYLKLDLSSLSTADISSARLRLRVLDGTSATQVVRLVGSSTWLENMTYNQRPATGTTVATFGGGAVGATIEVDLTAVVIAARGSYLSLSIESAGSNGVDFGSRESTTQPQLVVVRQ